MTQELEPLRVPEPKRKVRRGSALGRLFLSWFIYVVVFVAITVPAAFYAYSLYTAAGPLAEKKLFLVEAGTRTSDLGSALKDAGIIDNPAVFTAAAYAKGAMGAIIKPGEYEFAPRDSIENVLAMINSGKSIFYKVTIPEGWTTQMAIARLNDNDVLVGEITRVPAEGTIMADTYPFRRGLTRQKMLDDMQAAQAKLVDELWARRDPNTILKNKEEAVVLASIVEKETGVPEERPLVASVFINRLKQGMRLQSDPTTIYGIAGGKGKLDRSLTKDDLTSDTPYNTYRIAGLPVGPIANPGRAALEAVLNPPDTGYIYFVANGTGGHAFAKTLAEHNANVAKWRAIQSGQAAIVTTEAPTQAVVDGMPTPIENDEQKPDKPVTAQAGAQNSNGSSASSDPSSSLQNVPAPSQMAGSLASPTAPSSKAEELQGATPQDDQLKLRGAGHLNDNKALVPGAVIKMGDRYVPIPRDKPKNTLSNG